MSRRKGNGSCWDTIGSCALRRGTMTVKQSLKIGVACLLMAVAAAQPGQAQVPGVAADTIKIGSFGALTGPGYLYGKLPMNGIEVVFDQVNAAGGINGR